MNNGKYARQPRRRRRANRKKASFLLTSLILLLTLFIGGTTAFLIAKGNPVTNTFQPSTVTCRVDEDFDTSVKSNVTIANTGDTTAYIRATYIVTWKNAAGEIYPAAPVVGEDYTISFGGDWVLGAGGYYYYKYPVAKQTSTGNFIDQCAPVAGKTPEGYALNVEILGSAIQSVPTSVVTTNWKVTLNGDGNITG